MNLPKATFINMATVAIGSLIGIVFKNYFTTEIQEIVFQAVGLGTLVIGVKMALRLPEGYLLIFFFSLILGGIVGEVISLDQKIFTFSEWIKTSIGNEDQLFSQGLITSFLLFCIGSMTIVGALEEGLQNKRELLYVKSLLDGFSSIALASTYGVGVLFSIFPMLLFQGGITLAAHRLKVIFHQNVIDALSGLGGALIIGIGINLLKLTKINLENLLPSLVIVVIVSYFYHNYKQKNVVLNINNHES